MKSSTITKKTIVIIQDLIKQLLSESILDLRKWPNQKTHESESGGFLVWALSKVQNLFQKTVFNEVLYNYYFTFFCWEHFVSKNDVSKNGFTIVFSKLEDTARYAGLLLAPAEGFGQCIFGLWLILSWPSANSFLTFGQSILNTDRNAPKKYFRLEIWTFFFEICF